ncbi:Hypothetical predicted protein [Pelobates cultripes]|uniref:Uncharacterized protein n=1 Tax=Pelobates cultripes TaxID=61616 RepID=A0AAD1S0L9_PELCU|nr:Hypothetical predicted protein [Pelobates cultripes]
MPSQTGLGGGSPIREDREKLVPAQFKVWSNNVRGLNTPEKRSQLLRQLWAEKVSVALLQETHFRGQASPKLENSRFPLGYYANHPEAKKTGVAILFSRTVPFQLLDTMTEPDGRFLFLKGTIAHHTYTFACIYSPNRRQHTFLSKILRKLEKFREHADISRGP